MTKYLSKINCVFSRAQGAKKCTINFAHLLNSKLATVSPDLFVIDSRFEHGPNLPYGVPWRFWPCATSVWKNSNFGSARIYAHPSGK